MIESTLVLLVTVNTTAVVFILAFVTEIIERMENK